MVNAEREPIPHSPLTIQHFFYRLRRSRRALRFLLPILRLRPGLALGGASFPHLILLAPPAPPHPNLLPALRPLRPNPPRCRHAPHPRPDRKRTSYAA